jgi:hypothetical protein
MDDEAAWEGRPQGIAPTMDDEAAWEGRPQGIAPTMDDEAAWEGGFMLRTAICYV